MATTKFDVLNRFTGEVQFTAEIECAPDALPSVKLGLAVKWAVKAGANLAGAYLADAYLAGANLARANLAGAYLARANLAGAYLADAYLAGANLAGAKIRDGLTLTRAPMFIGPIGRENGTLIAYATNDGLRLQRGCFFGTVDEFNAASEQTHGLRTPVWTTYRAALAMIAAWDAQHWATVKAAA